MPYGLPRPMFRWLEPTFDDAARGAGVRVPAPIGRGLGLHVWAAHRPSPRVRALSGEGEPSRSRLRVGWERRARQARLLTMPNWRYLADDILPVSVDPIVTYYHAARQWCTRTMSSTTRRSGRGSFRREGAPGAFSGVPSRPYASPNADAGCRHPFFTQPSGSAAPRSSMSWRS